MDIRLPDRFAELLQAHGCAAHWIALEITESAILDDPGARDREPRAAARAGLQARDRRLRHRLFVACLSAPAAGERAQDRQVVRHGHGARRERRDDRALDDRPRPQHGARRSSPKASTTRRRSSACARSAATWCRAICSVGRSAPPRCARDCSRSADLRESGYGKACGASCEAREAEGGALGGAG